MNVAWEMHLFQFGGGKKKRGIKILEAPQDYYQYKVSCWKTILYAYEKAFFLVSTYFLIYWLVISLYIIFFKRIKIRLSLYLNKTPQMVFTLASLFFFFFFFLRKWSPYYCVAYFHIFITFTNLIIDCINSELFTIWLNTYFFLEFQPMTFTPDDSFYTTIRDFISWANWNPHSITT